MRLRKYAFIALLSLTLPVNVMAAETATATDATEEVVQDVGETEEVVQDAGETEEADTSDEEVSEDTTYDASCEGVEAASDEADTVSSASVKTVTKTSAAATSTVAETSSTASVSDEATDSDRTAVQISDEELVVDTPAVIVDEMAYGTLNGCSKDSSGWMCYFKNGSVDTSVNGFVKTSSGSWYYFVSGKAKKGPALCKKSDSLLWYIDSTGCYNSRFTGFASYNNTVYYVESGQVTFNKTGVYRGTVSGKLECGTVSDIVGDWYVINSKVLGEGYFYTSGGKTYYVNEVGVKDETLTGAGEDGDGNVKYVNQGVVDLSYSGFAAKSDGKTEIWIEKGIGSKETKAVKVSGTYYGITKGVKTGKANGLYDDDTDTPKYFKSGKLYTSYNGFATLTGSDTEYWVESGKASITNKVVYDSKKKTYYTIKNGVRWYAVTNSSMVSYTCISPNKTSPRNNIITSITIHHMASNLSIESCGAGFANSSRQASSNYAIGSDGRVGQYVYEWDRSWCSANAANDNHSITIEVADDVIGDDNGNGWHSSTAAINSLVNLCADICRRNNISSLNYTGTGSGNLNKHCDFWSTACPGDYLKSLLPTIAARVNALLGSS